MSHGKPTDPVQRWAGWTVSAIDAAITARRGKHADAIRRGDLKAALDHEGWIDHLLDGRAYLTGGGGS